MGPEVQVVQMAQERPKVAVIIPTRGKLAFVRQCLKSLIASGADKTARLEVVIIEQGGAESRAIADGYMAAGKAVAWMKGEDDWSYSKLNNAAAATTSSDYVLLLNNDTICKRGFLGHMLQAAQEHPDVGIVGAKLLLQDDRIQHIGVVFQSTGLPYHLAYGKPDDGSIATAGRDDYYDAVTFACALIRREVWDSLGGLDEAYHFNYEDIDFCLRAREAGYRSFLAHRAVLKHLEGQSGEYRSTEKHSIRRNLQILRDRWIYSGRLEKACLLRLNKRTGTFRDDRLNLAFMPSSPSAGVPWWRMELPAQKIMKMGLANVEIIYAGRDEAKIAKLLEQAHVLITQGFWSEWMRTLAGLRDQRPFGMVYDYDDHPIHISPLAQAYRTFGIEEIEMEADDGSKMWLWRDGQDGFNLEENMQNRQRQLEIFHLVDMVTTTVKPLQSYFQSLNPKVELLPNCIDFDVWKHPWTLFERTPGPVRIGWHGGDNHFHDWREIGQDVVKFVNSHDVRLVLFGAYYRSALRGIDSSKVEEHPWTRVEAFPPTLAMLGIDIGLIPLADPAKPYMAFNDFKSSIKAMEQAALRTPSLVPAGRLAYKGWKDRDNCLTYATGQELQEKLEELCQDAKLRRLLGARALEYVRENFDLERNIHRWVEAYEKVARGVDLGEPATLPEDDLPAVADGPADEPLRAPASNAVPEGSCPNSQ